MSIDEIELKRALSETGFQKTLDTILNFNCYEPVLFHFGSMRAIISLLLAVLRRVGGCAISTTTCTMKSFVFLLFFALAMFRTVDCLCDPVPASACAVLYSKDSCQGRSFQVKPTTAISRYFGASYDTLEVMKLRAWLRFYEADSISVAAGCTLVAYENENGRGRRISISAKYSDHHIADMDKYEHILDEDDIRSVECTCEQGPYSRKYPEDCSGATQGGGSCVPIRTCSSVIDMVKEAVKNELEGNLSQKNSIVAAIRNRACGDVKQKKICCKDDKSPGANLRPR